MRSNSTQCRLLIKKMLAKVLLEKFCNNRPCSKLRLEWEMSGYVQHADYTGKLLCMLSNHTSRESENEKKWMS